MIKKGIIIPILFVLLIPPIASLILGYEFGGHSVNNVPTAIVDYDNSTLSRDLVEKIRANDTLDLKHYGQRDDDIKNWIHSGEVAAGIIIPKNFSTDMLKGQTPPKILVIYDGAQMAMAGTVKGKVSEILETIKSGYLIQVMQGELELTSAEAQSYIQPIAFTTRFLGNPTKSSPIFFIQGILISIAQIAVFILGVELVTKKDENFLHYLSKGVFAGLVGTVSMVVALGIQVWWFKSPFNGSVITALLLTVLYMIGMATLGMLLTLASKKDKFETIKSSTSLSATMLLAGYTYPLVAMPGALQTVAKYMPFTYYALPLRDVALLGTTFQQVLPDISWLIKFIGLGWIGILMVCKSSQLRSLINRFISLPQRKETEKV